MCDKAVGQTINLGVGQGQTIGQMVSMILKLAGKPNLPIEQDPQRIRPSKSEVLRLISDNSKARTLCGWQPKYSLEEGLKETLDWIRKNLKKYRPDQYAV
jgi:nucleoside-diphosphate-sugar epimerase